LDNKELFFFPAVSGSNSIELLNTAKVNISVSFIDQILSRQLRMKHFFLLTGNF